MYFPSADKEFLHKTRDGNIFLHNAETQEESLYLSNSTFVIWFFFFVTHTLYITAGKKVLRYLIFNLCFHSRLRWMPQITCCLVIINTLLSKATTQRWETTLWISTRQLCVCVCVLSNRFSSNPKIYVWDRCLCITRQNWRHSFTASYSIYDRETS